MPKFYIWENIEAVPFSVKWDEFYLSLSYETIEILQGYHKGKKFSELMDINLNACLNGGLKIGNMKYVILKD